MTKSPVHIVEHQPPITEAQYVVLQILARLEESPNFGQEEIPDILFCIIPHRIVQLATSPANSMVREQCLLAELFICLCKRQKNMIPARILMVDVVLYLTRPTAAAVIYSMLVQEPNLFICLQSRSPGCFTSEDLPWIDHCIINNFLEMNPSNNSYCKIAFLTQR